MTRVKDVCGINLVQYDVISTGQSASSAHGDNILVCDIHSTSVDGFNRADKPCIQLHGGVVDTVTC